MQRWIVLGVGAVMLMLLGGGFAYWSLRQNRPNPVWVPLPLNSEVPDEKRDEIARELRGKLKNPALLLKISQDLHLAEKWHLPSDETAAAEIDKRLFVRIGEADSPVGKVPSMNIGVDGPRKDAGISGEIAMRLMKDVWKILGIKPPAEKPF